MENQQITKFLKLPFQFNIEKLQKELEIILESDWIPHFNTNGYTGNWNSIALYAQNGDPSSIYAMTNTDDPLIETPIIKNCDYLKEVIQSFKTKLLSVRLLKLEVGAFIKPHRDYNCGYENNIFRIHIPIITNPQVNFVLNEKKLEMKEGQCWYTNVNYIHSVSNNGTTDRVHLVIDCERNTWSDNLFFSLAPRDSFFPKPEPPSYSLEVMEQMIEGLKTINTEGAILLIKELELNIKAKKENSTS